MSLALTNAAFALSASEDDNQASKIAERGGGGAGRAGGGGHAGSHADYHSEGNRADYNHSDYNHNNFNHNDFNNENFNRGDFNRDNWNGSDWNAGAIDVVPEGEYVYPGAVAPVNNGDMNTLYQYESTTPQSEN